MVKYPYLSSRKTAPNRTTILEPLESASFCGFFFNPSSGWWLSLTPLKNDGLISSGLGWWFFPTEWTHMKCSKPATTSSGKWNIHGKSSGHIGETALVASWLHTSEYVFSIAKGTAPSWSLAPRPDHRPVLTHLTSRWMRLATSEWIG